MIDELLDGGTPIDAVDEVWGRQALRVAAQHGGPASVRHPLERGADPNLRDDDGLTAHAWCRPDRRYLDGPGRAEAEAILRDVTSPGSRDRRSAE